MKRIQTIGLATLVLTSLANAEEASQIAPEPIRLSEAVKMALRSNPAMRVALANFSKSKGGLGEVRSAYWPQLSLGASAMQFDRRNVIDLGAMMGMGSLPMVIAERWNPMYSASLGMQIDISGAVRSAESQAEYNALAARIDIDRVRNQLVFEVRNAFFQVQRAQAQSEVAESHLKAARKRLSDAKKYEDVGVASHFDVVSAERDVADAEQNMVATRTGEALSLASLKNLVGVDQSTPIRIVEIPVGVNLPVRSLNDGEAFATATKLRPEILESAAMVNAAKHGIHYAKRNMLPSLTAGLGYNYQPNNGVFTLQRSTVATVALSIPIFDGGLAKSRVQQAKADLAVAESSHQQAVDQVKLEVESSLLNLRLSLAKIKLAEAGLVQAEEAFRLAESRYAVGVSQSSVVSPQLELKTAEAALVAAKVAKVNAQIDLRIAVASLNRAMGRFANEPQEAQDK